MNNAVDHCCDTCMLSRRPNPKEPQCALCKSLLAIGLDKPFVKRLVWSGVESKGGGDGTFRVTKDELCKFRDATDNAPPGTRIVLPGEVKFVVDESKAQCVACEAEVFEVQAKGLHWRYTTILPDGGSAWICPECVQPEPVEM
ncbi:hypothetical protein EKK58_05310 [Candidatus Dependentiae bacterium]|nr:MAG: hypothetical protein EKK58_05310 [Candidatus Dependentiae bacterium]